MDILAVLYADVLRVRPDDPPSVVERVLAALKDRRATTGVSAMTRSAASRGVYRVEKRALDLLASGIALVILSPAFAVVAAMIKREDNGPVFYRALRTGRCDTQFRMYKFRTMVIDADRIGGPSTASGDPRVTAIGTHLRRWKLDELPQLINVAKGEMSLVGPRPQVPAAVATYTEVERGLLEVKPGVTDWASIKFSDEGAILGGLDDPDLGYERLIRPGKSWLGLEYILQASFLVDIGIIAKTFLAVIGRTPSTPDIPADVTRRLGLPEEHEVGRKRAIRRVQ